MRSLVSWLGQVPLFAVLGETERQALAQACRRRTFKPGQVIFHEGDPGSVLYVVRSGHVKIARVSLDGQETILGLLGAGECLGEMALLEDAPRSATAVALGCVEVVMLAREEFLALLERRPAVARAVTVTLARRIRRLNEYVQDALWLDVSERLARALLWLAEAHGSAAPEGLRIDVRLTQAELAQFVGVARPTVSKALSRFQQRKLLRLDRHGITLLRPERLSGSFAGTSAR